MSEAEKESNADARLRVWARVLEHASSVGRTRLSVGDIDIPPALPWFFLLHPRASIPPGLGVPGYRSRHGIRIP
jgi:hypothetical protein